MRRREILEDGLGYTEHQLRLIRRRRDELDALEQEAVAKRRRLRSRLRELTRDAVS